MKNVKLSLTYTLQSIQNRKKYQKYPERKLSGKKYIYVYTKINKVGGNNFKT